MIDVATRLLLAWILSETADADHSKVPFRMATRDKTREKIRYECKQDRAPAVGLMITSADNGTATRNVDMYASQLGLNTSVMTGRTYHANDKPYVERFFGTSQWQLLNFHPDFTGNRPGERPAYRGKKNATGRPDGHRSLQNPDEVPRMALNGCLFRRSGTV